MDPRYKSLQTFHYIDVRIFESQPEILENRPAAPSLNVHPNEDVALLQMENVFASTRFESPG